MPRNLRPSMVAAAGAAAALALVLAGCGGGSSKSSSGTTEQTSTEQTTTEQTMTEQTRTDQTTTKGGVNYDPATAILNKLHLQICSQSQLPSTLFVDPNLGFAGARKFVTAKNCSVKGPRTTIEAMTFSSHAGIAAGKAQIKKTYPKAGVSTFRTVVIGVIGPANAQQVANTITQTLGAGTSNG